MSMLFKRIKDWATSITAFRTGDVIPVDGPSGTCKMSKDTLLKLTAQNALGSIKDLATTKYKGFMALDDADGTGKMDVDTIFNNFAPEFVPSDRPNPTTTIAGQPYMHNGSLYRAKEEGYQGSWDASKFELVSLNQLFVDFSNRVSAMLTFPVQGKYLNRADGTIKDHPDWCCTGYVPVKEGETIILSANNLPGSGNAIGVVFYDSQKQPVFIGKSVYSNETLNVPTGAAFVVCSTKIQNGGTLIFKSQLSSIFTNLLFNEKTTSGSDFTQGAVNETDDTISIDTSDPDWMYLELDVDKSFILKKISTYSISHKNFNFYFVDDSYKILKKGVMGPYDSFNDFVYTSVPGVSKIVLTCKVAYVNAMEWRVCLYNMTQPLLEEYTDKDFVRGEFLHYGISQNIPTYSYSYSFGILYISDLIPGDKVWIDGVVGGGNARAWVTIDSDDKISRAAPSNASINDGFVEIKTGEKAILIQNNFSSSTSIKVRKLLNQNDGVKKIKILSISNSYGCDDLAFVPKIAKELGVDCECAVAYYAGASLQWHYENRANANKTFWKTNGQVWTSEASKNLEYIIKNDTWDYIIFQQSSTYSGKWDSYEPYLLNLMAYVISLIDYKCEFVFNMTKPYSTGYGGLSGYDNSQSVMYEGIKTAIKNVNSIIGITKIIPVGIAVQLARDTDLDDYGAWTTHQLSVDGTHLDGGIGRLLAAYTTIKYLLGVDIWTSKSYPQTAGGWGTMPDGDRSPFEAVTSDMALIAKQCACRAILELQKILLE